MESPNTGLAHTGPANIGASRWGNLVMCLAAVVLAAVGMGIWSWPLLLYPGDLLPWDGAGGSPAGAAVHRGVFELWSVGDRLSSGLNPLVTERLFAPHGAVTAHGSHTLLHGIVGMPLVALFGASGAYVGLWLGFGLLTCALGFALGRALGLSGALSAAFGVLLALAPGGFAGAGQGLGGCASPFPVLVALGVVRIASRGCGPGAAVGALWIGLGLGLSLWTGWGAWGAALGALAAAGLATWGGGTVRPRRAQRATTSPAWLIAIALFGFSLWGVPFRAWQMELEPPTRFSLELERGEARISDAPAGLGAGSLGSRPSSAGPVLAVRGAEPDLDRSGPLGRLVELALAVFHPRRAGSWFLALLIPWALVRGRASRAWTGAALGLWVLAALPLPGAIAHVALPNDLAPAVQMCLAAGAVLGLGRRPGGSAGVFAGAGAWGLALVLGIEPLAARGAVLRLERPAAIVELSQAAPAGSRVLHLPGALESSAALSWATIHRRSLVLPYAGPGRLGALSELARRTPDLFDLAFGRALPAPDSLAFELDLAGIDALTLTPGWTAQAEALEELLDRLPGFERVPFSDGHVYLWRRLTRS